MSSFKTLEQKLLEIPNSFDSRNSLKKHYKHKYSTRIPSRVDRLVLHHSASAKMDIYSIAEMHVNQKDWPGIGYHIVIDQNANLFLTNSLSTQSYHCKNHNFRSIGICCLGNFEEDELKPIQEDKLYLVLSTIALHFHQLQIFGHCELGSTLCPGSHFPLDSMKLHYTEMLRYWATEL